MIFSKFVNKSHLKGFVAGIVVSALLIPTFSFASGVLQQVSATIDKDIKITWNGSPFILTEPDGTKLYPIVYNNRTYLPVRYIAEKAEVKVGWDSTTRTVMLDNRASKVISCSEALKAINIDMKLEDVDFLLGSPQKTEPPQTFTRKDYRWQYNIEDNDPKNDGYLIVTFINDKYSGVTSENAPKDIEKQIEGLTSINLINAKIGKYFSTAQTTYIDEYCFWEYPDGNLKLTIRNNKVAAKEKV